MAARQNQMEEVKASLAALQEEFQEAKEERKSVKNQLETAILEGKPESVLASFKSLYDGASANLTRLGQKEAELLKRLTKLTHSHSSSDEETPASMGICWGQWG